MPALHATPRIQRKRAAKREQILSAALKIAAAGGLRELKLQTVAESLDLTTAALYRYFPSKEALLAALQNHAQTGILARFSREVLSWEALGDAPGAALERLLRAASFYVDLKRTMPAHSAIIGLVIGDPRELFPETKTEEVNRSARSLFALLERLFLAAASAGALARADARERAILYWAALHGATQIWKLREVEKGLKDPRSHGLALASALLAGWGAPPRLLESAARRVAAAGTSTSLEETA